MFFNFFYCYTLHKLCHRLTLSVVTDKMTILKHTYNINSSYRAIAICHHVISAIRRLLPLATLQSAMRDHARRKMAVSACG